MAILIALAHSAPSKVSLEDPDYHPEGERVEIVGWLANDFTTCSDLAEEVIVVTHDKTADGQSGKLVLDKKSGYLSSCYEPIGQQCKKGVKFNWNMYFPTGLYKTNSPYWMWANYHKDGEFLTTERYYGVNPHYSQWNPPSNEFELIDANIVKIVMSMNKIPYSLHAHATIEWECLGFDPDFPMSNKWVTNTRQMAQATMTKEFTPPMAVDYGCTGRGTFDAYGPTYGKPVNYLDVAFQKWKKCVKCASGEDETKIVPYYYDATIDSCSADITNGKILAIKTQMVYVFYFRNIKRLL